MPTHADRDAVIGVGLAFVAGFVDTAAFITLTGLFTAHVTGNFVLIGAELISTSTGVLAKLLALPVFILAVAVTRLIALALERRGSPPLRPLLALEAAVLIAFAMAGAAMSPLGSPDGARAIGVGMLGVAAMGIQNGIGRLVIGHLAATTVMTVNVTQAVIDLTDRLCGAKLSEQVGTRLRRTLSAVLAFATGALAGAFGVAAVSFWCVLVPAFILVGLLFVPDRKSHP
ncbi:MAG: YoaK family protein [Methylobacterium sp.]|nr:MULTISPECIES: YoaK family protein [unclassified Methylobacterium]MDO9429614.1 YoaK family protein [Methylobacterium sp.]